MLCLTLVLSLGAAALASGEPSPETVTQTWTEAQGAVSSYRPAPGTELAFVPEAQIQGTAASVDIYIDGVLYENVTAANYAELASLKDDSGLNGKKDVILTGVVEYADFDGGSVKLFNTVGPNDSILCIPNAEAEALARETFEGLFRYGTQAGVDAYYTFDHGYGLYVDGYYAETAPDCAYYAISGNGLAVLDGPANAIYPNSAAAKAGFDAPYTLAVTERDEAGRITAVYYASTGTAPNNDVIRLGLDGNAAVKNDLTDEYGKFLDYDFNGFTATADIAEPAIYLYTDALAYADGALNTYAPVSVDAIEAETAGMTGEEFANGQAAAYATNGGRLAIGYARVDNSYSVANCGILGMLEAGSVSWGLSQESGYNAMVYATNGGVIELGDMNGPRSCLRGWGQIQNGVFATGAGMYRTEGETDGVTVSAGTAEAYVYNADIWVSGWNGHVTDATRGGFVYIEDVEGYSGYPGSILGNGSGLTTDTGDGMVIAKDSRIEVFGMASGGMYIIGSNSTGVAVNCEITSWLDGGAVSASGGHIIGIDSVITGKAGFRNRGGATGVASFDGCTIVADNAYAGTVTMFKGTDHEEVIDFAYNKDLTEAERAQYVTNAVGDETLAVFELSLPDSVYRHTAWNDAATAMYDNVYCLAGANGYNGMWRYVDAFRAPYCWSNGESASYVTCFEFESSGMTLDLTNGHYNVKNTLYDEGDDTVVKDYDFLIVSEFGSNPTLNFIDHDDPVTGIIYNEGYTETHLNMGMPAKAESALTVNFRSSDFIGTFCDGDLGFWDTDVTYQDINGNETNKNGNYFCAVPNGKGHYTFDADSVWYVWSDSYCGTLTIADESCVKSYDGTPKTVYLCNGLTVGDTSCAEGDTVTLGDVTFIVDSAVFGQEPAPWTGAYSITAHVVADDPAMAAATTVTVPESADYGETFDIAVETPEGYGVAYVTACGKILGASENVQCTASYSAEYAGALDIEVAVAPVEGSDVWLYEENGDGTVTITGTPKYTENLTYKYVIVPAELDGRPVTGFGNGGDNVLYRSGVYSITFSEGIRDFAYQALYDLNGCAVGILPASAESVDEGFVRSMPAVTWGVNASSAAAQDFVDASRYAYEYINVWDEANIEAVTASAGSGDPGTGSGEASGTGSGEPSGNLAGPSVVLKGARILDATHDGAALDVLVRDGYIVEVGDNLTGDEVIDLTGCTLMPGLIDSHVHVAGSSGYGIENLTIWAQHGITSVREEGMLSTSGEMEFIELIEAANADPRSAYLVSCGKYFDVTGGYGMGPTGNMGVVIESDEDIIAEIDRKVELGYPQLKLGINSDTNRMSAEQFTTAIDYAHENDMPVAAHINYARYLEELVGYGLDEAAHTPSDEMSGELIGGMVEAGVAMNTSGAEKYEEQKIANLRAFYEAGGVITVGTDLMRNYDTCMTALSSEMAVLARAGLTVQEVIACATHNNAAALGIADTGDILPGYQADIVAVKGAVDEGFEALGDISFVMNDGVVIVG